MKSATRASATLAVGLSIMCLLGCPFLSPSGTTDMTTPAPCTVDSECGDGIACIFPNGEDQPGICDVDETQVSTGTPAPCNDDMDCPNGIACVFADESDQVGFCDIEEMQAP